MKIIYNKIIPVKGYIAINIFGLIFCRKEYYPISGRTLTHETTHTKQMKETLYLFFYLLYGLEWLIKLFFYGKDSYRNISFEREAYGHEREDAYPINRKPFAWIKLVL
jgi:hypothetical protein